MNRTTVDHEYERKRNELIPIATAEANRVCGATAKEFEGNVSTWGLFWNKTYLTAMNRMAREVGLL